MNVQLQQPNNFVPSPFMQLPQEPEEQGFDFWGILRRRKWLIFLGMLVGLAIGGIYNSQCSKVYQSKATVTIQPKEKQIFLANGNDPFEAQSFNLRHDQLIGEYNIVKACLDKLKTQNGGDADVLPSLRGLSEKEQIEEIQANLLVSQNREEQTKYQLEFDSYDAADAKTILATMVSTYEEYLDELYKNQTQDISDLLSRMKDRFEDRLDEVDVRMEKARTKAQQLQVGGSAEINRRIVADSLDKIDENKKRLSELSSDFARAEEALENGSQACQDLVFIFESESKMRGGLMEFSDNSQRILQLQNEIESLELQRDNLTNVNGFGPGHRQVRGLSQSIETLRQKILELEGQGVRVTGRTPEELLRLFIVSTKQQINGIRSALDLYIREYQEQAFLASQTQALHQRIEELQEERTIVLERAQIAKDQKISQESSQDQARLHKGFRFGTLSPASYGKDVWPVLAIILPIGALLGSLAGFGLGCLVELADKTFHNPDQITRHLQIPLIGHIPVITQGKRYLVENSLIEPAVCTYHRPKAQVSEAFRAVRTALYFNTQDKQNSVIQVTSPTPGDGKSTLASNLAVSIAQSGKRVLLVDADMRRPRQHTTFGITSRVGFATVLSGQSEWHECMFECEEIEGLTVMPCGAKPQNPAELSSSPQVKILIEEMREEFDFVIIDTPPMLAVTDPSPIAARVDGVILCMRIKKNVRVSAERATEMLQNLGANCIGLVVNGVGAQSGYGSQYTYGAYRAGYSYNGYGYGYGYGYGNENAGKYYEEDQKGRQARRSDENQAEPILLESKE